MGSKERSSSVEIPKINLKQWLTEVKENLECGSPFLFCPIVKDCTHNGRLKKDKEYTSAVVKVDLKVTFHTIRSGVGILVKPKIADAFGEGPSAIQV